MIHLYASSNESGRLRRRRRPMWCFIVSYQLVYLIAIARLTAGRTTANDNAALHNTYPIALFREDLSDGLDRKVYCALGEWTILTRRFPYLNFWRAGTKSV